MVSSGSCVSGLGAEAEAVAGVGGGDDLAGVHPVVGVEGVLDGLEGGVDLGAEELGVPDAPRQAVAVLAAHRPLELDDQVRDLARDRTQAIDPLVRLHVEDRPDVQAPDVGMAVARGLDAVPLDDGAEAVVEGGEAFGGDRRVLDEGDRLGVADHPHQDREAGLADLPEVVLVGLRQALADPEHVRTPLEPPRQVVGAVGQLLGRVGVVLRGQDGGRAPLGEAQVALELRVPRGQLEDHPVEHLDGRRPGRDDLAEAVERRLDGREREDHQPLRRRERDHAHLGPPDDGQGPLRADDQLRQVEPPGLVAPAVGPDRQAGDELVEVVAADPPEDPREPRPDGLPVLRDDVADRAMDRPHAILAGAGRIELPIGQGAEGRGGAVGQHDVDLADVIDRLAVPERPGARRVVADHPAERRPVARRDVGPEHQPERLQVRIELIEHDPRLDPHGHRVAIDDADPVHVLGEVDHDGRPDRLPGEARGRPSREDRHPLLGGDPDDRDDVLGRPRHDHAQGLDLVQARVGGVQPARPAIEADLGACLSAQAIAQAGGGGGGVASSQAHMPSWRSFSVGADLL